ncbi:MAG: GNAT family N-acetyltransferase [Myxococcales bacterium]|nr:GNAT family N-acetyltransferase [Myxococcales bacterium]
MRRYERGADGTWHDGLLMEWTDDAPEGALSPLRAATLEDVPTLLDMMDAFNRLEGIPWSRDACDGALRKLLCDATPGAVGLVVEGAESVGYFVLTWGYDLEWQGRDAWPTEFYLSEGVRGRGLGARALEAVGSFAKAHDARAMHLMVREDNASALRLYRRAGFEPPPRLCLSKAL